MNRIVLALGLMIAAPMALALEPDVRLSGTFALSLTWYEDESRLGDTTDLDLENNASNFRISAAAQEVGIRAFMTYERGASNDALGVEDVREFYGGLQSRYGTLLYGRKATDYRLAGERLDPFYNTSVAGFNGEFANEGAGYGLSNLTNGFTSNTIAYRSPAARGFSGNLAAYINENNDREGEGEETDFGAGIGYANSGWFGLDAGVQHLGVRGNVVAGTPAGARDATRFHVSVGHRVWALGLSLERIAVRDEAEARLHAFLAGSYQVLEDLRFALSLGSVSDSPSTDGSGGTVGMFYDVTKHLTAHLALRHVTLDNGNENATTTAAAGVRFVFDVDL